MKTKFNAKLLPLPKGILIFIMRVFILFFCISSFGFNSDELFSQNAKIKIDKTESISAEDAFQLIKLQTDYTFIYPSDLFNEAPKINLKAGIIPAKELLDKCLSLVSYTYEFTDEQVILLKEKNLFFDSVTKTISEQKTVTGTVTDSKGIVPQLLHQNFFCPYLCGDFFHHLITTWACTAPNLDQNYLRVHT